MTEPGGEGCARRGWTEWSAWGDNLISRPLMLDIDLRFITFASSSSSDSCLPFAFLFSLSRLETPSLRPRLPAPAAVLAITKSSRLARNAAAARTCVLFSVKRAGMKKRETPVDFALLDAGAIAFSFTGEPADAFDAREGAFALDAERADLDLRTSPVRHTLRARGSPFHRARGPRAREKDFRVSPRRAADWQRGSRFARHADGARFAARTWNSLRHARRPPSSSTSSRQNET